MKTIWIVVLAAAALLLLAGCPGYGLHGGWDSHESHMRSSGR